MIQFRQVSIKKGDKIVLSDIDFEIKKGENWGIIGENGSGKTTLLEAISTAKISFKGQIERKKNLKIAFLTSDNKANRVVHQAYQYYQQRYNSDDAEIAPTVYQIIQNQVKPLYTIDEKSVDLSEKLYDDEAIEYYANLLKINHLLDRKIITLSNGETRRVRLLNILLKKPQLLLLDNPFVGLDIESRKILQGILNDISTAGIQIIMVCAVPDIPENIASVLVLKHGKIERIWSAATSRNPSGLRGGDISFLKQETPPETPQLDTQILDILKSKPTIDNFETAIHFRHVTVQYNGEKVLNDINWQIKRGGKWALLGPNGSGKSTLLSLIMGDNPQSYSNDFDLFDKKRGTGESIWDIKKRIGFVSPELHLYTKSQHRVWEIIGSGLYDTPQLNRSLSDAEIDIVKQYLRLFELYELRNKPLSQLSTGQQRWVLLARALVKNPPLLILDEPCQGLDHASMVCFRELVHELAVSLDKTLIYVTHYEAEIPACVDKVFRLEKGVEVKN